MAKKKNGNGNGKPNSAPDDNKRTFKNWRRLFVSDNTDFSFQGMLKTAKTRAEWQAVRELCLVGSANWTYADEKLQKARS